MTTAVRASVSNRLGPGSYVALCLSRGLVRILRIVVEVRPCLCSEVESSLAKLGAACIYANSEVTWSRGASLEQLSRALWLLSVLYNLL